MKAIIREKAGKDLSGMKVKNIPSPNVLPEQVKVKMSSSRVNPVDIDLMKGMPFLKYKKPQIGGIDGAGTIIETGSNVKEFKIGDAVYFYRLFTDIGTWAEEITINASDIAKIPSNISIEQSGAIALPLLTAYDALMQLNIKPEQKILIHGAGGGVGFQAVQIAKKMGLYVLGTANSSDKDILIKAGIDQIIDYKTQQFDNILKPNDVDYVFDLLGGEILIKSISLKPKKIISVRYIEPDKMDKVGIIMPKIVKWLMKLGMKKFDNLAKKNNVELIGQVTRSNGILLQNVSYFVSSMNFICKNYPSRTLKDIETNGMSKSDLGKVILFKQE